MVRFAVIVLVALVACSSSSSRTATPAEPSRATAAEREPSLLDYVPADTPFLMSSRGSSFTGARVHDVLEQMREKIGSELDVVDDATVAALSPEDRMGLAVLKTMAALDADAVSRLGFDPARVELVAYTVGLVPVMRLRLDGAFLRQLFDRTVKDAGLTYAPKRFGAHEYWTWTGDAGFQIVFTILDDQLAVAMARREESILPHLVGAPAGGYPVREGTPVLLIDPVRLAALVEDTRTLGEWMTAPTPACARAIAGVLRTFPAIAATMAEPDRKTRTSRFVIGPSPAMAKAIGAMARSIPRWPRAAGAGQTIYGVGIAPLPALEALAVYVDDSVAAVRVCSDSGGPASMRDGLRSVAPLLAPVNGITVVIHDIDEDEDLPLQVELVADVTDPYAAYTWLASQLGLPPRPPTLGAATQLSLGFLPATIILDARAIAATLGRHDHAALDALRGAPAGPRLVARIAMGPGVSDTNPEGTTVIDATLVGDSLVFDMIERAP